MNKILRRLRSKAGESLIESMAAILIFTMGSIIMLSMVSTAADINTKAKAADKSYNEQVRVAEMTDMSKSTYVQKGTITISVNGVSGDAVGVDVFSNLDAKDDNPLYTFYKSNEVMGGASE